MAACAGAQAKPSKSGVVDSLVSRDTAIARFQRNLPPVTGLTGGAQTRDLLVRRFVTALESRDTAALRSLLLNRSEFAWLYFPTSSQGKPPYNLTPQLMWFMLEGQTSNGLRKLLDRLSGKPLKVLDYEREGQARHEGVNTVWGPCVVLRNSESGDTLAERLFGQIVERGQRYKFLSYANKL
jgi:hypothetical protein